jgi:2,5-furandicarboxylate decarboxylase 1
MKRKDAMFYNVMAGRAKEHNNLGYLTIYGLSKGVCAKIKESFSFVNDVAIHFDTKIGPLMHVVIAIKKSSDDQPAEIINKAFNLSLGFFNLSWMAKRVIIVDDDIDINNMDDVEWATWTRMGRAEKMHLFSDFITWEIDRAALPDKTSLRVGIDATKDMDYFDDLVKPIVPGIDQINLKDYL